MINSELCIKNWAQGPSELTQISSKSDWLSQRRFCSTTQFHIIEKVKSFDSLSSVNVVLTSIYHCIHYTQRVRVLRLWQIKLSAKICLVIPSTSSYCFVLNFGSVSWVECLIHQIERNVHSMSFVGISRRLLVFQCQLTLTYQISQVFFLITTGRGRKLDLEHWIRRRLGSFVYECLLIRSWKRVNDNIEWMASFVL